MSNTGNTKGNKLQIAQWQTIAMGLMLYDLFAIHFAYFVALWLRFDCAFTTIPPAILRQYMLTITCYSVFTIGLFWLFRMYRAIWRFVSYPEVLRYTCANIIAVILYFLFGMFVLKRMPITYYAWGGILQLGFTVAIRVLYRFAVYFKSIEKDDKQKKVMLIGAGSAGQMILRDIRNTAAIREKVVCIIDDDPNKWNCYIEGVPVVGGRDDIFANVEKYNVQKIYFAIPSVNAQTKKEFLTICTETKCELKSLPGMYQFVNGQVSVSNMKNVAIEDLLGREPIKADMKEVFAFINDKVVLVTGGGGSIGSELCRQIAAHNPKQLIIFDVYENNAYDIQLELRKKYPELDLQVLIGSVRDSRRMYELFETYRPQIVYHAAAHKHVPLMEDSPCEAIKNNAIGTYKTAYAAMTHGCQRFVLISTDKAVNPTNIMGASKRLCEMIIQSFDAKIKEGKAAEIPQLFTHESSLKDTLDKNSELLKDVKTEFVAVRFGNVLGSNGSVIPIFKKQIEAGGPVCVTHPDIVRYFMTIPEAVSLVMLAGTYAKGGEIFVLDMGSEVKIDTLARNLIKLSGFKPDVDIKIKYTGLRPGEKLYEEKLMAEEGLRKTDNELIHIGMPIPFETDEFLSNLDDLMIAAYKNSPDMRERVQKIVTTYHPADN